MIEASSTTELEVARVRSAAYALISYGFQYPDQDLFHALSDPARWSSWPEVLQAVVPEIGKPLAEVRALLCAGSRRSADDAVEAQSDWLARYNRLFGHAVRGKCPPYELEYGRSEIIQQASILSDVSGFYAAFGMEVDRAAQDRADHVTIESEFMSLLCTKEAAAMDPENDDHLDVARKAQRNFLKDHLACWLPSFAHRVDQADGNGWYGAIARFASTFLAAECGRFEIRPGPQTLEIHPADPVLDRTIDCATGDGDPHRGADERLVQLNVDMPRNQRD